MNSAISQLRRLRSVAVDVAVNNDNSISFKVPTHCLSRESIGDLVQSDCLDQNLVLDGVEYDLFAISESLQNCEIFISVRPPSNISGCCFFNDRWDMIRKVGWWRDSFQEYYLWNEDVVFSPVSARECDAKILESIQILKIAQILHIASDFEEISDSSTVLTFLGRSRIDIPLIIDSFPYGIHDTEQLSKIVSLEYPGHEMARTIVKSNLCHFLGMSDRSLRLTLLVKRFKEFSEKCVSEFRIFSASDKYSEVSSEIRDRLLVFEKSAQSIISDIYLKLFGFPIALGAVVIKSGSMTKSDIILSAIAVAFSGFVVVISTRSQRRLVNFLLSSITEGKRDTAIKCGISVNELSPRFNDIEIWCSRLNKWLVAIELASYILAVVALAILKSQYTLISP